MNRRGVRSATAVLTAAAGLGVGMAQAAGPVRVVSAQLVALEGDVAPGTSGRVYNGLNAPFTDGNGKVGFTGTVLNDAAQTVGFVFYDTQVVWQNDQDLVNVVSGGESTMGVSNTGCFLFSPSVNGNDAVYGCAGVVLQETDPSPGLPGEFCTFASRPTMEPDGTSHWVGGISATQGGSTRERVLYERSPGGVFTPLLVSGQVIDGFTIQGSSGIDFDYDFSDSSAHRILVLDTTEATTADIFVNVDGLMVLREADPAVGGSGGNWQAFDSVGINNSGNWVLSGDTSADAAMDEFVAFNGSIVMQEGMTVDGVTLGSGSSVNALSINNLNEAACTWSRGSAATAEEYLFVGDAATLGTSAVNVLRRGDQIDVNGDEVGDWVVDDFNASGVIGPGLDLGDDGWVYVEVDLLPVGGGTALEAIVGVRYRGGEPCPADCDGNGTVNGADVGCFLNLYFDDLANKTLTADCDGNGATNAADVGCFLNLYFQSLGDCP